MSILARSYQDAWNAYQVLLLRWMRVKMERDMERNIGKAGRATLAWMRARGKLAVPRGRLP